MVPLQRRRLCRVVDCVNTILLVITHVLAGAVGFVAGVYLLPILTAPRSPSMAEVTAEDIGAADRRRRNAQQRIEGADFRNWAFLQCDPAGLDEHSRFHESGHGNLRYRLAVRRRACASAAAMWRLTETKLSGLTDIESMPHSTRNSANSG